MIEHLKESFACKGQVTKARLREDIGTVVEAALEQRTKLRLYYQIDLDFSGIEPGAVWEDFKVGIKHLHRWERIAVITNVDWIRHASRAFGF
jgi:SpoIIAA-like